VGLAVGPGVGLAGGSGVGLGDGDGGAVGDGDGGSLVGTAETDGAADGAGDGDASADGSLGATTAALVEPGPAAAGRSIPPRWTTKPNEIPALRTRISSAATVARGTGVRRRGPVAVAAAPRR
jgi:hypothetical protein